MTDQKKPEVLADEQLEKASGGYKIDMTDVIISSYQVSGSAGDAVVKDEKRAIDHGVVARKGTKRG